MAKAVSLGTKNQSGATMILVALCLPALVGAMGLSAEVSYWYLRQRAMQNAANAAAIAAATNGTSGYAAEAKAVAAQYGFHDGSGNIVVAVSNPATAAGCTSNCYSVTISDKVPLFLSEVVGYLGTATANKKGATGLSAAAVATSANAISYCILALAGSGAQGITSNGVPQNYARIIAKSDDSWYGRFWIGELFPDDKFSPAGGWKDIGNVFIVALVLDSIYQVIVHSGIYALELLLTATTLALVPYGIVRGLPELEPKDHLR